MVAGLLLASHVAQDPPVAATSRSTEAASVARWSSSTWTPAARSRTPPNRMADTIADVRGLGLAMAMWEAMALL
jgi:hypothetical protein